MASLELRKNGIWHIKWRDKRGKQRSESTKIHTSKKNDLLAQKRLATFERDLLLGRQPATTLTVSSMLDDVLNDYTTNHKKSLKHARLRIENHLRPWFGSIRAEAATTTVFREYIAFRQAEGAKNGTINRELSYVRRGFTLAHEAEKLDAIPHIPKLKEAPAKKGFFEVAQFEAILAKLPEEYRCPIGLERVSGWRSANIRNIEPSCIDWGGKIVRLEPGSTKNDEGPVCPIDEELDGVLQMALIYREQMIEKAKALGQEKVPPNLFLYFCRGQVRPIGDFRKAWRRACYEAGIPCELKPMVNPKTGEKYLLPVKSSLTPHDFRRTAVRDWARMVEAKVAMTITGHKTRSVFDRYNIVSESDITNARKARNRLFAKRSQSGSSDDGSDEE